MSPAKPGEKAYGVLVKALTDHFNPTPSETVQRSGFNTRIRKPGESVATFVAELRSLAEQCNFGTSLDEMLHDRIVCGINNSKIRQKLLSDKKLTLTSAIETAQAMESAAKDDKEMMQQDNAQSTESVHRVTPPRRGKDTRRVRSKFTGTCFCCGKEGHKRDTCHLKDVTCRGCGKKGHIQRICRSKRKPIHRIEQNVEEPSNDSSEDHDLYVITSSSKPQPFRVDVTINDKRRAWKSTREPR